MTALQNKHYSGFCKATEEDCIKEYLAKKTPVEQYSKRKTEVVAYDMGVTKHKFSMVSHCLN